MSNLIISKGITMKLPEEEGANDTNSYKSNGAHTELARKMRKRNPATAPYIGDRVQYLMIMGSKGSK